MVSHLRACAVELVKRASGGTRHKIDKSVFTIGEPKRIRCKEHLRFVASRPCLICGRVPSQAHHVRYAQSRGLSLKVSDEFTVPLCAVHHHHIHTTGKERDWWLERNIDPLKIANALWQQSHERQRSRPGANALEDVAFIEGEPVHQAASETDTRATAVREPSSVAWRSK